MSVIDKCTAFGFTNSLNAPSDASLLAFSDSVANNFALENADAVSIDARTKTSAIRAKEERPCVDKDKRKVEKRTIEAIFESARTFIWRIDSI